MAGYAGGRVISEAPTVRPCKCVRPHPATDPRRIGWCVACLGKLPELSDDCLREFYRQVRDMLDVTGHPDAGEPWSVQALRRHEAGKGKFNWRWVRSDGADDGQEEQADAGNYAAYEVERGRRLVELFGADESDVDAAKVDFYEAAYHAALSHQAFRRGQAKLREALE